MERSGVMRAASGPGVPSWVVEPGCVKLVEALEGVKPIFCKTSEPRILFGGSFFGGGRLSIKKRASGGKS